MKLTLTRLAATTAACAAGVLAPSTAADAATAPSALPRLPWLAYPASGSFAFPAGFAPSLVFYGPQVAIGPTVIGAVFNGGTSVVTSTGSLVNSGNVIGSP